MEDNVTMLDERVTALDGRDVEKDDEPEAAAAAVEDDADVEEEAGN